MSKESISKIYLIIEKIEYIEQIIDKCGNLLCIARPSDRTTGNLNAFNRNG